jgi:uncharacterized membrane protein
VRSPEQVGRGKPARLVSVDILRGLVMAIMALDHTRDFFTSGGFDPRDVTQPALFLTRWITHFCAPTFIFLAGLSAFLYGRWSSTEELSRFLLIRGLWLILLDLTLIKFGWRFEVDLYRLGAGVIFVIGVSMVMLAALIWLPRWALASVILMMLAGHNLLDDLRAEELGEASGAWHVLHEPGLVPLGDGMTLYILYPLIPWIGVMAAGYLLCPLMQLEDKARQRFLFRLGATITLGFIILRASNLYGDPAPWIPQETWLSTVLSFLNCEKYPPSLLYLMMTLGPALMLLASFEHARGGLASVLATFGRVPFFYYVVHIYLVHALAVATAFAMTGVFTTTPEINFSLASVYLVWLVVLGLLYPICRWFAELKEMAAVGGGVTCDIASTEQMGRLKVQAQRTNLGHVTLLRPSHVSFVIALVAAVLTCGSLTEALANGKVHGQTSHLPGWHAERDFGHGWGWDPTSVGYYEGPIWGRHGNGYFRCFDPVYGWHSCDRYVAIPHRWVGPWPDRS